MGQVGDLNRVPMIGMDRVRRLAKQDDRMDRRSREGQDTEEQPETEKPDERAPVEGAGSDREQSADRKDPAELEEEGE